MHTPSSPLLTDLYELTMLHAYAEEGMREPATFEFFARKLPEHWGFLLAGGLPLVLDFLENTRFSEDELAFLSHRFPQSFIEELRDWRFQGEVHAVAEGTPVFPNEPILRVTAPIMQAQLVESRIINLLQFCTLITTKAARCRIAAGNKMLVDFGFRRAHGYEAGELAARAAYIGGFDASATVSAGYKYGVPLSGTMAHAYIQAHERERDAFVAFARAQPDNVILLIDTYDTEEGAKRVLEVTDELERENIQVKGVRLDSGDLADHARKVRRILDDGQRQDVKILASGGLDEYEIRALIDAGAPIDGYGVGTSLTTCAETPYLDCAYKLSEFNGQPRRKRSEGKATWPGRRQIYRRGDKHIEGDTIGLAGEELAGQPLLEKAMADGKRLNDEEPIDAARERVQRQLTHLPDRLKRLHNPSEYPVDISASLRALAEEADRRRCTPST